MGSVITATCKCGYKTDRLFLGSGMSGYKEIFPAICSHCKIVVAIDYFNNTSQCPTCKKIVTFYNDNKLKSNEEVERNTGDVFSWGITDNTILKLPNIHYLCPRCGQYGLKFEHTGYWD